MRGNDLSGRAFGIAAIIGILVGCGGGSQPQVAPMKTTGSAKSGAVNVEPNHSRSWMAPDAKAKDLLYVTNAGYDEVLVYSYPQYKLVGTLTGFYFVPDGVCTDKKGNVWIVNNSAQENVEYKHGGTSQIASLSDPGYYPTICSVDPTTGNLAVANKETIGSSPQQGNVAIYAHAKGTPKLYADSELFKCGSAATTIRATSSSTALRATPSPSGSPNSPRARRSSPTSR